MLTEDAKISLADLAAAGVRLRHVDAVTIVRELIIQLMRGAVPGVPSAHVIRLTPAGLLTVEGPVAAGGRAVVRAATLLDSLLPPFDAPPDLRVPGALRLIVARALGTLDVPAYDSLEEFAAALERFGEADAKAAIRRLTERWEAASYATSAGSDRPDNVSAAEFARAGRGFDHAVTATALVRRDPASLTVSDIRRARRATGLPLIEISARSRIPVPLLRQLEWGYLENWPIGLYGRTQLVRYARAAGLDEQIVTGTVWPLLEQVERERRERSAQEEAVEAVEVTTVPTMAEVKQAPGPPPAQAPAAAHVADPADVPLEHVEPLVFAAPTGTRARWKPARVAALFAAAAMFAVATLPGVQDRLDIPDWTPAVLRPVADMTGTTGNVEQPVAQNRGSGPPSASDAAPAEAGSAAQAEATGAALIAHDGAKKPAAQPARGLAGGDTSWSPAFATVGSAMFYHAQDERSGSSAIVRADTDGRGAVLRITRVLDDNSQNFHARPSPDGSQIAFDSDRDGERGVYVADSDGGNVRRVSGEGFGAVPSWSPDGHTLAFVRAEPDRPRVWNLWLADLRSGDLRRLTSHRYGSPWGGSWFPDGKRLAYSREDRLVVLDLDTGRERVYPSPRKGRLVRTPAVSPDGRRIIFQVHRDGAWLLDLSDGSTRKVLADPTAEEYAWSPDGRRVAYHSRRSGEWGVWLMLAH